MDKNWDYAELSRMAKEHGNPKQLVQDIYDDGYQNGEEKGIIEGVVIVLAVYETACLLKNGGVFLYNKISQHFSQSKSIHEKAEHSADELIKGINDYDADNDDNNIISENTEVL